MKLEQSINWAHVVDKNVFFIISVILVSLGFVAFLIYTYDRSFRVHQETILRAHASGICPDARFFYNKIHVGHDGTTLEASLFPQKVGPLPIDPASGTAHSPPGEFALLTLSLVLLMFLFYFVTTKGEGGSSQ